MKSITTYIAEAFDKPYKWKDAGSSKPTGGVRDWQSGNFTGKKYEFETEARKSTYLLTVDKRKGEVYIYEWDIIPPKPKFPIFRKQRRMMEMHFSVEDTRHDSPPMRADISGEGDAMRIFATVLDVVASYVKKNKPDIIRVIGVKTKDNEIGSRLNLYQKLVKRYAGKLGYKYNNKMMTVGDVVTPTGLQMSVMELIRKGFDVMPKVTIRSRSGKEINK